MPQLAPEGPVIPDQLLREQEDDRLVFFCGAGISMKAGFPDFKGLLEHIVETVPFNVTNDIQQAIKSGQYDFALALMENRVGGQTIRKTVRQRLTRPPKTLDIHKSLIRLARIKTGGHRLITSNFDTLFKQAGIEMGIVIDFDAAPKLPVPLPERWKSVVHIHGCLDGIEDSGFGLDDLVLSSANFGEAYITRGYAARFILEVLRHFTIVFIGYGINDPVMRYLLDAIAISEAQGDPNQFHKPFAFVPYGSKDDQQAEKELWKSRNIEPIFYLVKRRGHHQRLYHSLNAWADKFNDGTYSRRAVLNEELNKGFLPEDTASHERVLWALRARDGIAAKYFAEREMVPPIDWLPVLAENGLLDQTISEEEYHDQVMGQDPQVSEEEIIKHRYNKTLTSPTSHAKLAPITRWLVHWLMRHLNEIKLVDCLIENGGVPHPDWAMEYRRLRKIDEDETTGDSRYLKFEDDVLRFWDILVSDSYRSSQRPIYYHFSTKVNTLNERRELLARCELIPVLKPVRMREKRKEAGQTGFFENFDCKLGIADHQNAYHIKTFVESENYPIELAELCEPLTEVILRGFQWLELFGKINAEYDRTYFDLPSISPHPQNQRFEKYTLSIELLREAFNVLVGHDRERAILLAWRWAMIPYPLFSRLVLYGATVIGDDLSEAAVKLLVKDNGRCLWFDATREVLRFLRKRGRALKADQMQRLCAAILAGSEKEKPENISDRVWKETVEHSIWKRLAKLEKSGAKLPDKAREQLHVLNESYNWQLADDNQDEFPIWMGKAEYVDRYESFQGLNWQELVDLPAADRVRQILSYIEEARQKAHEFRIDEPRLWRGLVHNHPDLAQETLEVAAEKMEWCKGIWGPAYSEFPDAQYDEITLSPEETAQKLSTFVLKAPDPVLDTNIRQFSYWLCHGKTELENSVFLEVWDRLWPMTANAETGLPDGDPLEQAIYQPSGMLMRCLLIQLWPEHAKLGEGLPESLTSRLELAFDENDSLGHHHARVTIVSRLEPIHSFAPGWSTKYVVPLLSWDIQSHAIDYWQAFLWGMRITPDLMANIKDDFIHAFSKEAQLGEKAFGILCKMLVVASIDFKTFSIDESKEIMVGLNNAGLIAISNFLVHQLRARGDKASDYWKGSVSVRQAKLVISCKVKVLVWRDQRSDFVRFNQPPVSSVTSPAERC